MKKRSNIKFTLILLMVAVLLLPGSLAACTACYGQSDSPLANAMNWGILTLLGVILSVLGGIAVFFVHVGRRTAAAKAGQPGEPSNIKS